MKADTTSARRAEIRRQAEEAFANHVLTWEGEGRWRCGRPGTRVMHFRVLVAPDVVILYGDAPVEQVVRTYDRRPLPWLRAATRNGEDYFIEKCAIVEPQVFMPGDARDYLDDLRSDEGESTALADGIAERWEYSEDVPEPSAWLDACYSAGDDEPPDCCDGSSRCLWAFHACRTFIRLHDACEHPAVVDGRCTSCGEPRQVLAPEREAENAVLRQLVQTLADDVKAWLDADECDCPPEGHHCGRPKLKHHLRQAEQVLAAGPGEPARLLAWKPPCDTHHDWRADFGGAAPLRFEAWPPRHYRPEQWSWRVAYRVPGGDYGLAEGDAGTVDEAQAACEAWLRDWLGAAGAAAMRALARERLERDLEVGRVALNLCNDDTPAQAPA